MRKRKQVIISTVSEQLLSNIEKKLEDMGIDIVEIRYDLLWKRYDVYAKVTREQAYELLEFTKIHDLILSKGEP